ncbi:hypothetical protein [Acinetobacter sp. TUM15071]|uniref:hypothetical protein n=1 Tax=Acinetobacter sp. TUM15071 TaxID=2609135 RepID=UPI00124E9195|nr:hypothetical protein [Acinetobacter sp. TUM15071]
MKLLKYVLSSFIFLSACSSSDPIDSDVKTEEQSIENVEQSSQNSATAKEIAIPMQKSGYDGKYFLVSDEKKKYKHIVVYRSVWVDETVFSKDEIDCKTRKYRSLGEGKNSLDDLTMYQEKSKWVDITEGGSSEDIVDFICSRRE